MDDPTFCVQVIQALQNLQIRGEDVDSQEKQVAGKQEEKK